MESGAEGTGLRHKVICGTFLKNRQLGEQGNMERKVVCAHIGCHQENTRSLNQRFLSLAKRYHPSFADWCGAWKNFHLEQQCSGMYRPKDKCEGGNWPVAAGKQS